MIFFTVLILMIAQRIYELQMAKKNTRVIRKNGGIEFGANHYWIIVGLHTLFFMSMLVESYVRGIHPPFFWPFLFLIILTSQAGRVWLIHTMKGRWTTRILVIPKEQLVVDGPFRFLPHPNYTIVVIEILIFPLIFGLFYTSIIFTTLNALVLLAVRIPEERRALDWAKSPNPTMQSN